MPSMTFKRIRIYLWPAAVTMLTSGLLGAGLARVSTQETHPAGAASTDTTIVDRYQRTFEVLGNNEVAPSGAARGQTIYFYKCWMCHNNGARNGDKSGLVGPSLANVAARLKTDEALAAKINMGGARMPAFRHTFTGCRHGRPDGLPEESRVLLRERRAAEETRTTTPTRPGGPSRRR